MKSSSTFNRLFLATLLQVLLLSLNPYSAVRANDDCSKHWTVEAESPATHVEFRGNEIEMWSPKGLTLWYNTPMEGDCTIEYEACVVYDANDKSECNRVSDLNCFWKASDPSCPDDIFHNKDKRKGVFVNCYSLQLYYLGYGGNYNSTTRFRRYDGNSAAIERAEVRPKILQEYTDKQHLLKPNHWYHIKIECEGKATRYYIDGEKIIDFTDENALNKGWFGFRTTLSHTKLRKFTVSSALTGKLQPSDGGLSLHIGTSAIPLHWIGEKQPVYATPQTFGVPFNKGEMKVRQLKDAKLSDASPLAAYPLAYWADGTVKWAAFASVINPISFQQNTGNSEVHGQYVSPTSLAPQIIASLKDGTQLPYVIDSTVVENANAIRSCTKICAHIGKFPSVLRVYSYKGTKQTKLVHSFVYDGDQDKDFIQSLGIQVRVPLKDELYNRHVAFLADDRLWTEPVQPLAGRRLLNVTTLSDEDRGEAIQRKQMRGERIPPVDSFDVKSRQLLKDWASWSRFRLSQLNDMSYTIRKQAKPDCSLVGTFSGKRASGMAFVGDKTNGLIAVMKDFWQSYPSSIEITEACSDTAKITLWLWSPEAEAMDLRHYDTVAHGLNSSYEDIQEGMSTPQGIARTSEIVLLPTAGYCGPDSLLAVANELTSFPQLACTPE